MLGNTTYTGAGRRRAVRFLTLAVTLLLTVATVSACETVDAERNQVIDRVNQSRAENGLPALAHNSKLDIKADKWAQKLRGECALSHSRLADGAPSDWSVLGENVGYGGTIDQVHEAYLNSPGHRRNILDPRFTSMGAAAVWGTCDGQRRVFTVQVFMRRLSEH